MRELKIGFVGFWDSFYREGYKKTLLWRILTKHYNVNISNNPDYLFCGLSGEKYGYIKYPQIRILLSGENYIPDFNLIDYAASVYPLSLQDRSFQLLSPCHDTYDSLVGVDKRLCNYNADTINKEKPLFASLIASYDDDANLRSFLADELSKYRRVECAGAFKNNMPNHLTVNRWDLSKFNFMKKCKFNICIEHVKHQGFITEKLNDAFYSQTIPIYYGDESACNIYKKNCFIQIENKKDVKDIVEQIISLDKDPETYVKMINENPLKQKNYFEERFKEYEKWLLNIFEQPYKDAYRRPFSCQGASYEHYLKTLKGYMSEVGL